MKVLILNAAADLVDYKSPDIAIPVYEKLCEELPGERRKLLSKLLYIEVKTLRSMMSELRRKKIAYVKDRKFYDRAARSVDHLLTYTALCFEEARFNDPKKWIRRWNLSTRCGPPTCMNIA